MPDDSNPKPVPESANRVDLPAPNPQTLPPAPPTAQSAGPAGNGAGGASEHTTARKETEKLFDERADYTRQILTIITISCTVTTVIVGWSLTTTSRFGWLIALLPLLFQYAALSLIMSARQNEIKIATSRSSQWERELAIWRAARKLVLKKLSDGSLLRRLNPLWFNYDGALRWIFIAQMLTCVGAALITVFSQTKTARPPAAFTIATQGDLTPVPPPVSPLGSNACAWEILIGTNRVGHLVYERDIFQKTTTASQGAVNYHGFTLLAPAVKHAKTNHLSIVIITQGQIHPCTVPLSPFGNNTTAWEIRLAPYVSAMMSLEDGLLSQPTVEKQGGDTYYEFQVLGRDRDVFDYISGNWVMILIIIGSPIVLMLLKVLIGFQRTRMTGEVLDNAQNEKLASIVREHDNDFEKLVNGGKLEPICRLLWSVTEEYHKATTKQQGNQPGASTTPTQPAPPAASH